MSPIQSIRWTESIRSIRWIVAKEVRDALRSRWLLAYAVALALLGLAAALAGTRSAGGLGLQAFGRTTATLTNLCLLLAPLVALAMGALAIAGERDRGTLDHLLAQPIARHDLLLGKYLGLLAALSAATAAGFAPAGLAIALASGPGALPRLLPFVALASLLIAAMLAVGVLISVKSSGAVQALGLAIVTWFLLVLLYDLLLIGALLGSGLGAGALAALLVSNPVDAARVLVVLSLEPDLYLLGPAGALMVETLSIRGTALVLCGALLLWTVVPLAAAVRSFRLPPAPSRRRRGAWLGANRAKGWCRLPVTPGGDET
ncbi:MAG TPA: ABC transporter permease subunit [Thermoanaerobaculia bacterium]|nr:ABC transporter permease subunit [Thermoanaerobaculia bacterium]